MDIPIKLGSRHRSSGSIMAFHYLCLLPLLHPSPNTPTETTDPNQALGKLATGPRSSMLHLAMKALGIPHWPLIAG